jgi:hypothetical protein
MKHFRLTILVLFALGAGIAGCSNDPTVTNGGTDTTGANVNFIQIDREGRPGIKELYLPYATHEGFNRVTPLADTSSAPEITAFVTGAPAGRSAAIASYLSALLAPDALVANLNSSATRASFLGYETGGTIMDDCTGLTPTAFGGRSLTDDVVNAQLGLVFGNLATSANPTVASTPAALAVTPPPDDGKEQNGSNGTPNLTTQNVSCSGKGYNFGTFPYLAAPL